MTLIKSMIQVLQNQIEQSPVQPQIPVVEGDAFFNLLRHHRMQLTIKQQEELFPVALDIMERFQNDK